MKNMSMILVFLMLTVAGWGRQVPTGQNNQVAYTPCNTYTLTPTLTTTPATTATITPLAVPVLEGSTMRISSFGNSHWAATWTTCDGGDNTWKDGARPAFLAALNADGASAYYVGTYLNTFPTPLVQNSRTNAVGGTNSNDAYTQIVTNLATLNPSPSANDRVLLMTMANDVVQLAVTAIQERDLQYRNVTTVAAILPLAKIWLTTDMQLSGFDYTAGLSGVNLAYTKLIADGYSQVILIDTFTHEADLYPTSYCNGPPDIGYLYHLTAYYLQELGGWMAAQLIAGGNY